MKAQRGKESGPDLRARRWLKMTLPDTVAVVATINVDLIVEIESAKIGRVVEAESTKIVHAVVKENIVIGLEAERRNTEHVHIAERESTKSGQEKENGLAVERVSEIGTGRNHAVEVVIGVKGHDRLEERNTVDIQTSLDQREVSLGVGIRSLVVAGHVDAVFQLVQNNQHINIIRQIKIKAPQRAVQIVIKLSAAMTRRHTDRKTRLKLHVVPVEGTPPRRSLPRSQTDIVRCPLQQIQQVVMVVVVTLRAPLSR